MSERDGTKLVPRAPREILERAGCLGDVLQAYDAAEIAENVSRDLLPGDLFRKIRAARQLLFEVRVELEGNG